MSDDKEGAAPLPTTDWGGSNDDDEPPAAGAAMILEVDEESEHGLTLSMAPTAEPEHRAEPQVAVTA